MQYVKRKTRFKRLHTEEFHLYDILEKASHKARNPMSGCQGQPLRAVGYYSFIGVLNPSLYAILKTHLTVH
jgi:hypothetical protein